MDQRAPLPPQVVDPQPVDVQMRALPALSAPLLEVVAHTLGRESLSERAAPLSLEIFRPTIRRFADLPECSVAVAESLVQDALSASLADGGIRTESWRSAIAAIVSALNSDELARARLARLWRALRAFGAGSTE